MDEQETTNDLCRCRSRRNLRFCGLMCRRYQVFHGWLSSWKPGNSEGWWMCRRKIRDFYDGWTGENKGFSLEEQAGDNQDFLSNGWVGDYRGFLLMEELRKQQGFWGWTSTRQRGFILMDEQESNAVFSWMDEIVQGFLLMDEQETIRVFCGRLSTRQPRISMNSEAGDNKGFYW